MPIFKPGYVAVAAVSAATGVAAAIWWERRQYEASKQRGSRLTAELEHPALEYGVPRTTALRVFSNFVIEYDFQLRNPRWCLEVITPESVRGDGSRQNSVFVEDEAVDPRFRGKLSHFRGSGYDRGHLVPASNHKLSQKTMDETFVLTNTSPQVGAGFNRDYWARFERFVQNFVNTSSRVFVITGPLYLPSIVSGTEWYMQYKMLGQPPQMMAVPTHFFKVVLAESSGVKGPTPRYIGAFVLPNAPINADMPLAAYSVPLSALEDVVGTEFFPHYIDREKRTILDGAALRWQSIGKSLMDQRQLGDASRPHLPLLTADTSSMANSSRKEYPPVKREFPGGNLDERLLRHVCDYNNCTLPPEKWWQMDKRDVRGKR